MYQKFLVVSQILLAVIYSSAGFSKLFHWFPNLIGPVWLIEELEKYNLGLFGYFIALSQLSVGTLLFFPRCRLIASILLLPIHICITIVPISLGWQGTPLINIVLLTLLVVLLFDDRKKMLLLIRNRNTLVTENTKRVYWVSFIVIWFATFFIQYGIS
jgi:uncharacterized membrane protein YphA (DoxX/SURF4 family)